MRARFLCIALIAACGSGGGSDGGDDTSSDCPTEIVAGGTCAVDGQSCAIEGTGVCDQEPPGGTCTCGNGTWRCESGCAAGCPAQRPADGATCGLTDGSQCRYEYPTFVSCTCSSNTFTCM
ncbi:MAG TPA: hypothetical protein VGM39_01755 [Kofleriaceae bacterium]